MNTISVAIIDATFAGNVLNEMTLQLEERVTAKDIIRSRVYQEVEKHNASPATVYAGILQFAVAPKSGVAVTAGNLQVDAEKQYYIALDAFQRNRYFIIVNEVQVTSLDEQIQLSPQSKVTFIKLSPLVGG